MARTATLKSRRYCNEGRKGGREERAMRMKGGQREDARRRYRENKSGEERRGLC